MSTASPVANRKPLLKKKTKPTTSTPVNTSPLIKKKPVTAPSVAAEAAKPTPGMVLDAVNKLCLQAKDQNLKSFRRHNAVIALLNGLRQPGQSNTNGSPLRDLVRTGNEGIASLQADIKAVMDQLQLLEGEQRELAETVKKIKHQPCAEAPKNVVHQVNDDDMLDASAVSKLVGMSRSTMYAMRKAGTFPQPKAISNRCVRWKRQDVLDWQKQLPVASSGTANLGAAPSGADTSSGAVFSSTELPET